ncbi:MAG: SbcC/MukB-like Walker B domain-containing protein, partial [Gemmiger sp.]|nr:SbcC/MukB-like Walker B domain-containing protein [Gemmiger sp.]
AEEAIPAARAVVESATAAEQAAATALAGLEATATALAESEKAARAALPLPTRQAAEAEIAALRRRVAEAEAALQKAEAHCQEIALQAENQAARLAGLDAELKTAPALDGAALAGENNALQTEKKRITDEKTGYTVRLHKNRTLLQSLQTQTDRLEKAEAEERWARALSDTANGQLGGGREKLMLETYVQTTYFDRIITRANTRFMVMSAGQYELARCQTAENNRAQSGLELDVIDHYNGSRRSVKTLSGGESFMASLSLALGLSDEVQSAAGGIQLDTMFVDEGFGTLDEDTLQQALQALAALTKGNRLVGIISHVAELKTRIDHQIIITKTRENGSHAEIVVP